MGDQKHRPVDDFKIVPQWLKTLIKDWSIWGFPSHMKALRQAEKALEEEDEKK